MKKNISLSPLLTKGKCLFLAYDQGLEHGPTDFDDTSVDPAKIIKIAQEGACNAFICQKGIAEKYHKEIKVSHVPLILKLNGKTNLVKGEPLSTQLCTVSEAITLGATAVGYTLYIGSEREAEMFEQFEQIEREAHAKGLPVVAWIYPRGKAIEGKSERELLAYATRTGLELGADIVKVHWNGDVDALEWAVKAAGKCKVVIAGGLKTDEKSLLKQVKEAITIGVIGCAVGRNIWQHKQPLEITKKIQNALYT